MSEGQRSTWAELPEETQVLDNHLLKLLSDAIPPANPNATSVAGLDQQTIREAIEKMRQHKVPTWVVPIGTFVDHSIPVNVVHSPLVEPGYFIHVPVDAFGSPPPWLD